MPNTQPQPLPDSHPRDKWGNTGWEVLEKLLRERGITEYVAVGGALEGAILPTGLYNFSEGILTRDGMVTIYILDWDDEKIAPDGSKGYYTLRHTVTYPDRNPERRTDPRDLSECKQLGLPLTPEQEVILCEWEKDQQ